MALHCLDASLDFLLLILAHFEIHLVSHQFGMIHTKEVVRILLSLSFFLDPILCDKLVEQLLVLVPLVEVLAILVVLDDACVKFFIWVQDEILLVYQACLGDKLATTLGSLLL